VKVEGKSEASSAAASRGAQTRFPWIIFWIALAVRLAAMTLGHYYRFSSIEDHFGFGWEMGRVARSLATGHGYGNVFSDHPSGPTAWVTPLYPLILAADFRLFGVYSALSAWVILAFDSLLNALMVRTTWEIATRCFNRKVAVWSAWIWALYPAAMQFAVKWIWETTLTAFLFSCILVLALRMRNVGGTPEEGENAASAGRWAVFGLLWGMATLSSASIAVFLPLCGLWIAGGFSGLWRQAPRIALAAAVYLACILPWTIRNTLVFHHFVPMRTNFGAELWADNLPGGNGMVMGSPVALASEEVLLDRMGEYDYCRWRGRIAMARIREDPKPYLQLSLRRCYFFWADLPHAFAKGKEWTEYLRNLNFQFASVVGVLGLALAVRRRAPAAWLFAMAFAVIPFLYYFTFAQARFRHPLEPLIAILGVYLFQSAEKSWRVRGFGRG
jgi:hypothetical protein